MEYLHDNFRSLYLPPPLSLFTWPYYPSDIMDNYAV